MRTYQKTVKAEYGGDWRVMVTFEGGQSGVFDFTPYRDYPCYAELKKPGVFASVCADHGTMMWPGDIDIAPETVWQNCLMNREPDDCTEWQKGLFAGETFRSLGARVMAFGS